MMSKAPFVFCCLIAGMSAVQACSSERLGRSGLAPSNGADATTPQSKESASKSRVENGRAVVTAVDARAKGLPAIGFTVTWSDAGLFQGNVFNGEGNYLTLSGPPGGPLGMAVWGYTSLDATHATLEKVIAQHPPRPPVIRGAPESISLAGAERPALAYIQGESLARSVTCLVLVPAAGNKREGLIVTFYVAAGSALATASCKTVVEDRSIAPLVASFRVL